MLKLRSLDYVKILSAVVVVIGISSQSFGVTWNNENLSLKNLAYAQESQEQPTGGWKTFEDSEDGISFVYPSDYFLTNTSDSAGLFSMNSEIYFTLIHIPLKNTSLIKNFTDSVNMSIVTQFDFETLKNIGIKHINALLKNNSNSLLIANVTADKWRVDGKNAISYTVSVKLSPGSDYMCIENILFSNDKSDMYYGVSFTAPFTAI